ncbi:glycoside hydrolase family 12 protein [Stereum hirsutum FP-91666 SS1]|uniref:glycoside hydrolase family 12 protein n=1 Tax=Stereum hirsutum (strain FP-91666) TaxID=721885 RepID=UPI00044498FE|nr:glycoside hydrolase family 12 protein [Stereum hirsutum FP-91666 SS1]EIM82414.1 glycoside hydrolase family 12 protein [Stereum hirsutum FP-91666 SS1]
MFTRTISILLLVLTVSSAFASPLIRDQSEDGIETKALSKRGAVLSAQFATESEASGVFILENNLWGEAAATSGSQTSQVTATSGTTITWHTTYTWAGGPFNVKSYANLDLRQGLGKSLTSIASIPTTWDWTYTTASSDLVADVSYDMWLSNSATGMGSSSTSTFEVMVWLSSRGGAGPAGSQIGTANVNGVIWNLFRGTVETWTVLSFVAPSEITSFSQDLKPFFTFLTANQGVPADSFLVQLQAGTEPFVGSATLTTSAYNTVIN